MSEVPAVLFRGKVHVGETHNEAVHAAFKRFTDQTALRVTWRIMDGKENIVFGYANRDTSGWLECGQQEVRKEMYGFK